MSCPYGGDEEVYEEAPESRALQASNDAIKETVRFFSKEKLTEEFLQQYAELKTEHKALEELLETMKLSILDGREPDQKTLAVGRMVAFFTDVKATTRVDWPRLVKDLIGNVSDEDLKRYTLPGREGHTQVSVRKT